MLLQHKTFSKVPQFKYETISDLKKHNEKQEDDRTTICEYQVVNRVSDLIDGKGLRQAFQFSSVHFSQGLCVTLEKPQTHELRTIQVSIIFPKNPVINGHPLFWSSSSH